MKVIFLNTWGATQKAQIKEFINRHSPDTDIFLFQEVLDDTKPFFSELLKGFKVQYANKPNPKGRPGDWDFFVATYIKQSLAENSFSEPLLQNAKSTGAGLYTKIETADGAALHFANIHGQSRPGDKLDTPERIQQSEIIIDYFSKLEGLKIIGGDFNLDPKTKSVEMFKKAGYRNLIKEFNIKTTRNEIAWSRHPQNRQYFADYVFCSPELEVKGFEVPGSLISDHLPLILEF